MDLELINEILEIIRSDKSKEEIVSALSHYHDYDLANAIPFLNKEERNKLFEILDNQDLSDMFTYLEEPEEYLEGLDTEKVADIIELMDADDAVDILDELDEEERQDIIAKMDEEAVEDITMIKGHDEDMVGSFMTTNFITVKDTFTIPQAMKQLIKEAAENDNIMTLYVVDDLERFVGTISLKDLIIARKEQNLSELIKTSYPFLHADETLNNEVLNKLKEYNLDLIPVLDKDEHVIGVITSADIIEASDEEKAEDYAKLGGLVTSEDLNEPILSSIKKRIPWLILLLFLGLGISMVISTFEAVIVVIPMVVFFQSLIFDMAGNCGTQSLAVTIRVLTEEQVNAKTIRKLMFKELKIGFLNGLILGVVASIVVLLFLFIQGKGIRIGDPFIFLDCFKASLCVGISLIAAMAISSFIGSLIPVFFKKIKIDPAVASGPFITTLNDLVAVMTYYSLAVLFFNIVF